MAVEPNQLPEDGRGAPTNPIRMPPKGLSKDKLSGPLDLDSSQRPLFKNDTQDPVR